MDSRRRRLSCSLLTGTLVLLAVFPRARDSHTLAAERPSDAEIERMISRAAEYLKSDTSENNLEGSHGLIAYALLNAGVPADDPSVVSRLETVKEKFNNGKYTPTGHHFYEAGVDVMALEKADPDLYRTEIEEIALYIVNGQMGTGPWFYPGRPGSGDTSITQYSVLGLWAAARSGIRIPNNVWDRSAAWLVSTQLAGGNFTYHPPGPRETSHHAMTVAGVACLYVAKLYLDPESAPAPTAEKKAEAKPDAVFGVLEKVPLEVQKQEKSKPVTTSTLGGRSEPSKRTVTDKQIDEAIGRGVDWLARNYREDYRLVEWKQYYLYGLERMTALTNMTDIAGQDWYGDGAAFLLERQQKEGHWLGPPTNGVTTSFAILFLSRATGKLLRRAEPGQPAVGGGLLAGGRGLPENLAEVQLKGGDVKTQKLAGPMADMLSSLENPAIAGVLEAQTAIIEKIQFGDREELVGQKERLLRLLADSRVEVRRTALWALGRTGDIRLVPKIIRGLNDESLDVAVEARNALCWISRRPGGLGLPDSPLGGVSEDASEDQKQQAIQKWRADAVKRWTEWYASNRPYDERDDSLEETSSE
jgi:hypothetical protein